MTEALAIIVALIAGPICRGTEAQFAAGTACPADLCAHQCELTDSGRVLRRVYTGAGINGYWEAIPP